MKTSRSMAGGGRRTRTRRLKRTVAAAVAAIVVKQAGSALRTGSQATGASVLSQAVTAGSYLLLFVASYDSPITSVVGANNGAFTKLNETMYGNYNRLTVWGRANAVGGVETITVTPQTPANGFLSGMAMEVAGLAGLDKATSAGGTLTVTASGPNVKANALVIAAVVSNTGGNAGFGTPPGYALLDRENDADTYTGYQVAYRVATAIETPTATATSVQSASLYNALILSMSGQ